MFDTEEFIEEGYSPDRLAQCIELAMVGLMNCKTKEAIWLNNHLESLRDDCESV